jgi:hypothetical protein
MQKDICRKQNSSIMKAKILSHVLVTETVFGFVIGILNHLELATTFIYNAVPDLHNSKSLHHNLLRLFPVVFKIRFLAMDPNTGIIKHTSNTTAPSLSQFQLIQRCIH